MSIVSLIDFVNAKLAIEVMLAQVFIAGIVLYFLFFCKQYPFISTFLAQYGIFFAFLTSLIATVGSLFYSEVAGFEPCSLCWYQRIFMYPEVVVLGLALLKKVPKPANQQAGIPATRGGLGDKKIVDYALSLSIIGFFIALFQNFINLWGDSGFCLGLGSAISCAKLYVFEFGYVTIPVMSATAFALVITFLLFVRAQNLHGKS